MDMIVYSEATRQKIVNLRLRGFTYPEICSLLKINVPKGSMSYICRNIVLGEQAVARLSKLTRDSLELKRQKAMIKNKLILEERVDRQRLKALDVLAHIDINSAKVALAFLYWGEGSKRHSYRGLSLGNSDPHVIKTYMSLLNKYYSVPMTLFRARILCRADQDAEELKNYWSKTINLPLSQFYLGYTDKRTEGKPTKNSTYKGVCVISGGSADIQLELDAIARNFLDFII